MRFQSLASLPSGPNLVSTGNNVPATTQLLGTFHLSPTTRSITLMVWSNSAGVMNITSIIGHPSGIDWSKFINIGSAKTTQSGQPDASFNLPTVVTCPVYASVDSSITITIVSSVVYNWSLLESADDVLQGSAQEPLATFDPYGVSSTVQVNGANGVNTTLLAAPPSGFYYNIQHLALNGGTTANNLSANARIQGATSTYYYLGAYDSINGIWLDFACNLNINEGLVIVNSSGVIVTASALYRTIPKMKG